MRADDSRTTGNVAVELAAEFEESQILIHSATVLVGVRLVVPWRMWQRHTVRNASAVPSMKSAPSPP